MGDADSTLSTREARWVEELRLIEDRHERLAAFVEAGSRLGGLSAEERCSGWRVPGCVSAVWMVMEARAGRGHFRGDAESPFLRALATQLAALCDGAPLAELAAHEFRWLEASGLSGLLTTTRLRACRSLHAALRAWAARQCPGHCDNVTES